MSEHPGLPRGLSSLDAVAPDSELRHLSDSLGVDAAAAPAATTVASTTVLNAPTAHSSASKDVIEEATTLPAASQPQPQSNPLEAVTSRVPSARHDGPKDQESGLVTGSFTDPPKKTEDHVESLISGIAGVAITAPLAGLEKLGQYAASGAATLKTKADEQGLSGITNTVCDGVSSITNHPSVAPYLQSASDKASTVTANASDLSSKATDSNNLPSRDQISEAAKGAAGSASAYASSAATVATEGVQNVGAKVGLTSSATAPNAPSFEASQGASTHEDVLQPGSAEYGAGTQGSTKPDSTVA